jgi:hypothetical protein
MSAYTNWKEKTTARLAREIGVLGEIIVDDVVFELGLADADMTTPRQVMAFLTHLQRELPETIDREAVIREIANELLSTLHS